MQEQPKRKFNLLHIRPVRRVLAFLDDIYPPGLQGASLYSVGQFFFKGIFGSRFNMYAAALSFNFFLAIFPAVIFIFTIIAYIPYKNLTKEIFDTLNFFLPDDAFKLVKNAIKDILSKQRGGLLSFGFISALYFASNGFFSMMLAFDHSLEDEVKKKRNFFHKRARSIGLTFMISLLLMAAITVSIVVSYFSGLVMKAKLLNRHWIQFGLNSLEFVTLSALVFFIMSTLYYYGPSNKNKWKFFSPGAIMASVLSLASTYAFSSYVNNFHSYNKLYGSIGAIIVLMLMIYFNTLCILVGFELNRSIDTVVRITQKNRKKENRFLG